MYDVDYYQRDIAENWYAELGLLRPDEYAAACYLYGLGFVSPSVQWERRDPGRIVSIGCGHGRLERWLEDRGHQVIGVDPSPGATDLYLGAELVETYDGTGDTVLFVESIEHIPRDEIISMFQRIPLGALVVIVNWLDVWPIKVDRTGWDHITRIDDEFFDELAEFGGVQVRKGSHLVLTKGRW